MFARHCLPLPLSGFLPKNKLELLQVTSVAHVAQKCGQSMKTDLRLIPYCIETVHASNGKQPESWWGKVFIPEVAWGTAVLGFILAAQSCASEMVDSLST